MATFTRSKRDKLFRSNCVGSRRSVAWLADDVSERVDLCFRLGGTAERCTSIPSVPVCCKADDLRQRILGRGLDTGRDTGLDMGLDMGLGMGYWTQVADSNIYCTVVDRNDDSDTPPSGPLLFFPAEGKIVVALSCVHVSALSWLSPCHAFAMQIRPSPTCHFHNPYDYGRMVLSIIAMANSTLSGG